MINIKTISKFLGLRNKLKLTTKGLTKIRLFIQCFLVFCFLLAYSSGLRAQDSDGDGIADLIDIDDDNDGIPDADENICSDLINYQGKLNYEFFDEAPAGGTLNNFPTSAPLTTGLDAYLNVQSIQYLSTPADANTYSIRYTGYFYAETSATYTFYSRSDDGSRIIIDGTTVVNNDGVLAIFRERSGTITLDQGYHAFTVLFFVSATGSSFLSLSYATPSISKKVIPMSLFYSSINCDNDKDGIPNITDLDSDNDGIYDIIEAGGVDVNGDGKVDSTTDADGDGLMDIYDPDQGGFPLIIIQTDSDNLPDFLDIDADGDGIVDVIEAQPSSASPTLPLGVDANSNGIDDAFEASALPMTDTDLDGIPDYLDADSDEDGHSDALEAWDTNGDWIVDVSPASTDTDEDGMDDAYDLVAGRNSTNNIYNNQTSEDFPNITTVTVDSEKDWRSTNDHDRDGIPDITDLDDDNDGIPDETETTCNGKLNYEFYNVVPSGNTLDNFPTSGALGTGTTTNNSVTALRDIYTPGEDYNYSIKYSGYFYAEESADYTFYARSDDGSRIIVDGTIVVNNDGLLPVVKEVSGTIHLEKGFHSFTCLYFNSDWVPFPSLNPGAILFLSYSTTTIPKKVIPYSLFYSSMSCDNDLDGLPNSLDLDSDNDGIYDIIEAGGVDVDGDGMGDSTIDADSDGQLDLFDTDEGGTALTAIDTDGDGLANFLDIDADGDGIVDVIEAQASSASPILPSGTDVNGNGMDDAFEASPLPVTDTDGDNVPDYLDTDADGDSILDAVEGWDTNGDLTAEVLPASADSDGDGLDNAYDSVTGPNSTNNVYNDQTSSDFPNITTALATSERDWRESNDHDLDGVPDSVDLDDDNDGIPDADERICYGLINYEFYDSTPSGSTVVNIPASGALATGQVSSFDVNYLQNLHTPADADSYAIRYTGYLLIDVANTYTFYLSSDDGSRLSIDGALVVDNDGNQIISTEASNSVYLTAGAHNFTLLYFEDTSTSGLSLSYSSSTITKTAVPFSLLSPGEFCDSDGDGIPNQFDLDSDNDGIPDIIEAGGTDTNAYGRVDSFTDTDGDGLADTFDTDNSGTPLPNQDRDNDGLSNAYDLDSDNDGIADLVEAGSIDTDRNGRVDTFMDTYRTGWANWFNSMLGGSPLPVPDTDADGLADYLDIDSDGDGIVDIIEAQPSGTPAVPSGIDSNRNGIDDTFENNSALQPVDTDVDGIPDYLDINSDNDIASDLIEGWDTNGDQVAETTPSGTDTDGDGLDDSFDLVAVQNSTTNVYNIQSAFSFPRIDSRFLVAERDWRFSMDTDGDGILNEVDLDADNDGIPDVLEQSCSDAVKGRTLLQYEYYNEIPADTTVNNMPTTGAMATGVTNSFDVDAIQALVNPTNPDNFSIRFTGYIEITTPDNYTFYLTSDDGSRLYIDEITVVDNDGQHVASEASGSLYLTAGFHTLKLEYFEIEGVTDLSLSYSTATMSKTVVPLSAYYVTPICDVDRDGLPNELDLDSDNDGIMDIVEAGGVDVDHDGKVDTFVDTDGDGYADLFDSDNGGTALPVPDTDGDGLGNFIDLDSDGDGIVDVLEAQLTIFPFPILPIGSDIDSDGIDDTFESSFLPIIDTDGDGSPDYKDTDSDGDGVSDQIEAWDINGDLTADTLPAGTDSDGDGIDDAFDLIYALNDTTNLNNNQNFAFFPDITTKGITLERDWRETSDSDGDGISNAIDLDDDNDGILDTIEDGCTDKSKYQGKLNYEFYDLSPSGNTVSNIPTSGANGAGTNDNYYPVTLKDIWTPDDPDTYSVRFYGYFNAEATANYTFYLSSVGGSRLIIDGTTVVNNDGDHGTLELSGSIALTSGFHTITMLFFQNTGPGLMNLAFSTPTAIKAYVPMSLLYSSIFCDRDNDGTPNSIDLDSDNDGIYDIVEAGGVDVNQNGLADNLVDADLDGLVNIFDPDQGGTALPLPDTDADGIKNYLDIDSDGDGIVDVIEAQPSTSSPYLPLGTDANHNGIDDAYEANPLPLTDTDSDGIPDYLDTNSDNDPLTDAIEGWDTNGNHLANKTATGSDTDKDGLDNAFDLVSGTNATSNVYNSQTSESFPAIFSFVFGTEKDWRADNDYDGDGILDDIDQDDDNDGVADGLERTCTGYLNYQFYDLSPTGNTVNNIPATLGLNGLASSFDAYLLKDLYTPGDPDTYSIRYTGYLNIAVADTYTFYLKSDDGSRLLIDGVQIIDHDGIHTLSATATNSVYLTAGAHSFTLLYFENTLSSGLSLSYSTPTVAMTALPFSMLSPEGTCDTDGDGIINIHDLDSDGDGIPDLVEAGGTDSDHNGLADNLTDTDADGLVNLYDTDNGGTTLTAIDTDSDGKVNFHDIDADGDGIVDIIEAQPSTGSPIIPLGTDANNNGIDDVFEGSALPMTDMDGDGLPDYIDTDSDKDLSPDALEGWDTDGDLTANTLPSATDSDGDGLDDAYDLVNGLNATTNIYNNQTSNSFPDVTTASATPERDWRESNDHDSDGVPDVIDLDDDNDGIPDTVERSCSGVLNYEFYDLAPSGNTVSNIPTSGALGTGLAGNFSVTNLQGIHTPADVNTYSIRYTGYINIDVANTYTFYLRSDDGSRLLIDGAQVIDNDGVKSAVTEVSNTLYLSAGVHSITILYFKTVGGSILSLLYSSSSITKVSFPFSSLSPTKYCDTDADGVINRFDLDSDNDGIPDIIEAGGVDNNADGRVDTFVDTDGDGLANVFDTDNGGTALMMGDRDADAFKNAYDLDSDNDGIPDIIEAGGVDSNHDGKVDGFADTDADGWANTFDSDNGGTKLPVPDTDGDGLHNYRDIDSDGDGIVDLIEAQLSGSSPLKPLGTDTNRDGIDNVFEGNLLVPIDTDADGIPDYIDTNSDNDALPDLTEGWDTDGNYVANTVPVGLDTDSDGLDNAFDLVTGPNRTTNISNNQTSESFPNVTTVAITTQRDWREVIPITCKPGDIGANLLFWLMAEPGYTWSDKSGNFHSVLEVGSLQATTLNYNPAYTFDGADLVNTNLNINAGTNPDLAVIAVYKPTIDYSGAVWGEENGGNDRFILDSSTAGFQESVGNGTGTLSPVSGLFTPGVTSISTVVYDDATTNGSRVLLNGGQTNQFTASQAGGTSNTFQVGALGNSNSKFSGTIAEIIVYNQLLTSETDLKKIQSYLSLKYAVTMSSDTDGDGTAFEAGEGDYIGSDGTTVYWDASANATYHHNVTGIVRDDGYCLNQRQSLSDQQDAIVSIGLDDSVNGLESTNALNESSFSGNFTALMWGHDGEPLYDHDQNIDYNPLQVSSRLNREWRVQKTGTIGNVTIRFDVSALIGPKNTVTSQYIGTNDESQIVLLIDADGDFSSGAQIVMQSLVTADDGLVNFNLNIPDGTYFTLASTQEGALDIHLLSFTAKSEDSHIKLNWTTASETDNAFFRIERSSDGMNFESLGTKDGAGNSSAPLNYTFKDLHPLQGIGYYRLVDVDNRGNENKSEVVSVFHHSESKNIQPYPNPFQPGSSLYIDISEQDDIESLSLRQMNGAAVSLTTERSGSQLIISPQNISQGVYILTLKYNGEIKQIRIIVSN